MFNSTPRNRKAYKVVVHSSLFPIADHVTHVLTNEYRDEIHGNLTLPQNLKHLVLGPSCTLNTCVLPDSLQYLKVNDIMVKILHLSNHPNLTVLRLCEKYKYSLILPEKLVELEIINTKKWQPHSLPISLTKLCCRGSVLPDLTQLSKLLELDIQCTGEYKFPNMPDILLSLSVSEPVRFSAVLKLPSCLTMLNLRTCYIDDICLKDKYVNVRSLTCRIERFTAIDRLSECFPNLHTLQLCCPVVPVHMNGIKCSLELKNWHTLKDLSITFQHCPNPLFRVCLPETLLKFELENRSLGTLEVCLPSSVTSARLHAHLTPNFQVTMRQDSRLRTLNTFGNVFAKKIIPPQSLRVFHVTLFTYEPLEENWAVLPKKVDLKVIRTDYMPI